MPGSPPAVPRGRRGIDIRPDAVRQARQEAGLSLAQLGGDEMTRAAMHLVESGKMRPSSRTLQLIARRTGRPISYFLPTWEGTDEQRARRDELERLVRHEEFRGAIELAECMLTEALPPSIEADVRLLLGSAFVRLHEGRKALAHL